MIDAAREKDLGIRCSIDAMGRQVSRVSIQVKALAGGQIAEYLALVERDRPGTL